MKSRKIIQRHQTNDDNYVIQEGDEIFIYDGWSMADNSIGKTVKQMKYQYGKDVKIKKGAQLRH